MKTQTILACAVAVLTAFLTSCALSVHPLYKSGDTVSDKRIVGTWLVDDDSFGKGELVIAESGGHYEASFPADNSGRRLIYDVSLVKLGDDLFADVFFKGVLVASDLQESPPGTMPLHGFLKFSVNGDTLHCAFLDQNWLEKQFAANKASIAHEDVDEDRTVITASPAEIQELLKKLSKNPEAFSNLKSDWHRKKDK